MYVSSDGEGSGESAQKPPMFDDVIHVGTIYAERIFPFLSIGRGYFQF